MVKEYKNKHEIVLPIKIGMEVIPICCMGCFYTEAEIDKCLGYQVTGIKIYKDGKVYFDIEKDKNNSTAQIPLSHLGKLYFLTVDDAIHAISDIKEKEKDGTLDDWLESVLN